MIIPAALMFDLDGLLIDSEKLYRKVSYEMAGELGKSLTDEILAKQMARSPVESMRIFMRELGISEGTPEALVNWRDKLMLREFNIDLIPMPGAIEILEAFHGLTPMAIATGSEKVLLNAAIDTLNIRRFFTILQPSDEIAHGKPNPEIYLRAASRLGVDPENCVVLEDSSNGSMAGKKAGCYVIAIPNEHTQNQDFTFVDVVVKDLFEAKLHIHKRLKTKGKGSRV